MIGAGVWGSTDDGNVVGNTELDIFELRPDRLRSSSHKLRYR